MRGGESPLLDFYGGANGKLSGGFCSISFDFAIGYVKIFSEFETINSHISGAFRILSMAFVFVERRDDFAIRHGTEVSRYMSCEIAN